MNLRLLVAIATLASSSASTVLDPKKRELVARGLSSWGGFALLLNPCPSNTTTCGNRGHCCPSSTTCNTSDNGDMPVCCPTSTDCYKTVLAVPVCADNSWDMYQFASYFCCTPDTIGIFGNGGTNCIARNLPIPTSETLTMLTQATATTGATVSGTATAGGNSVTRSTSGGQTTGSSSSSGSSGTSSGGSPSLPRGAVIAIVVLAGLVILLGGIIIWFWRRRKSSQQRKLPPQQYPISSSNRSVTEYGQGLETAPPHYKEPNHRASELLGNGLQRPTVTPMNTPAPQNPEGPYKPTSPYNAPNHAAQELSAGQVQRPMYETDGVQRAELG